MAFSSVFSDQVSLLSATEVPTSDGAWRLDEQNTTETIRGSIGHVNASTKSWIYIVPTPTAEGPVLSETLRETSRFPLESSLDDFQQFEGGYSSVSEASNEARFWSVSLHELSPTSFDQVSRTVASLPSYFHDLTLSLQSSQKTPPLSTVEPTQQQLSEIVSFNPSRDWDNTEQSSTSFILTRPTDIEWSQQTASQHLPFFNGSLTFDNFDEVNGTDSDVTHLSSSSFSGDTGSGLWYGDLNTTLQLEEEHLLPVDVIIDYVNLTLDGSGSGSGYFDNVTADLSDWIKVNDTIVMADSSGSITSPSPATLAILQYSMGEMIVVSILLGVLTLWTVFGNLLVLISLGKFKSLRSMSNLLIGNLAVCDFLLALTVLPMSVVNDVLGHWVFGEILCNLWLSTDVLYCTASIWSLCVIAMDRFTATSFPVWYRNKRSLRRAVTYIVIVWVFSVVVTVPPLFGWQDRSMNYQYSNETQTYMCVLFTNVEYVIYSASGSFIIPLFLQLALYAKIFITLRRRSKQLSRAYRKAQPKRQTAERVSLKIPPREMELSTVSHTEDSKYLFSDESSPDIETRSDCDDEEMGVAIIDRESCLYSKHSQPCSALLGKSVRNGNTTEATDSETLVIHNPGTHLTETDKESQSDQEKMTLMKKKRWQSNGQDKDANKKAISVAKIKQANPFKRDKMRTSLRKFDKREQRATQRMGIIITCFAVCWLPFLFMYLVRSLCASCPEMNHNAQAFLIWLGYANSGLNPILYTIFNDDFRKAFYNLVCCCLTKSKTTPQHL